MMWTNKCLHIPAGKYVGYFSTVDGAYSAINGYNRLIQRYRANVLVHILYEDGSREVSNFTPEEFEFVPVNSEVDGDV